jgi:hypothetical protein
VRPKSSYVNATRRTASSNSLEESRDESGVESGSAPRRRSPRAEPTHRRQRTRKSKLTHRHEVLLSGLHPAAGEACPATNFSLQIWPIEARAPPRQCGPSRCWTPPFAKATAAVGEYCWVDGRGEPPLRRPSDAGLSTQKDTGCEIGVSGQRALSPDGDELDTVLKGMFGRCGRHNVTSGPVRRTCSSRFVRA